MGSTAKGDGEGLKRVVAVWDRDFNQFVARAETSVPEEVAGYLLAYSKYYGVQPDRFDMVVTTMNDVLRPKTSAFRIIGVGEWKVLEA